MQFIVNESLRWSIWPQKENESNGDTMRTACYMKQLTIAIIYTN